MLSNPPRRLGAVIAGGQARRFGGDKGAALLDGRPLIDHAIAAIAPFVDEIVIVGRAWGGHASIGDRPSAGLGPLGGINAALHAVAPGGWTLTIGCDMPDVPGELIAALIAGGARYCADAPVLGCWPGALAAALDAHLAAGGERSVRRWAAGVGALAVPAPHPLANINTPDDLAAL